VIDGHGRSGLLDAGGSVELVLEQRLDGGDAGFHRLQQGLGHGAPAFNCAASERAMPMAPAVNCLPSLDSTAAAVKRVENRIWSAVLFSMNLFSSVVALLQSVEFFLGGHGWSSDGETARQPGRQRRGL
jgi:hypothetical protein